MAAPVCQEKIIFNFVWKGPSSLNGGVVRGGSDITAIDLIFKGAKTTYSVDIPGSFSSANSRIRPFTSRKYEEIECESGGPKIKSLVREAHPNELSVTIERMYNLTITAQVLKANPHNKDGTIRDSSDRIHVLRSDEKIQLKLPEEWEIGGTYRLVVTSNDDCSLSAGFVRDWSKLTEDELKLCIDKTLKKDKVFKVCRIFAALIDNSEEVDRITELERANDQIFIKQCKALEKKRKADLAEAVTCRQQ